MSNAALTWAFQQDLPMTDKFVLVALADYADDENMCYPAHRKTAFRVGGSESTVKRAIRRLEKSGHIETVAWKRTNGSQTSNRYRLQVGGQIDPPVTVNPPGGQIDLPPQVTSDPPVTPSNNPQKNHSLRSAPSEISEDKVLIQETVEAPVQDPFDTFWETYPKRADKGLARRSWAKVLKAGVDPQHVIRSAGLYADQVKRDGTETRYVKNPSTWLNAESYDDPYLDAASATVKSATDSQWDF